LRRIEPERGRQIDAFGSVDARVRGVSRRVHQVVFIEIGPGGILGRHPAASHQLFAVVTGSGWVSGADGERELVSAGEVVIWDPGEEHESGSDDGMTAIVVEAEELERL
jgi:quercetin dioxygenase-like cupin family protein